MGGATAAEHGSQRLLELTILDAVDDRVDAAAEVSHRYGELEEISKQVDVLIAELIKREIEGIASVAEEKSDTDNQESFEDVASCLQRCL